MEWTPVIIQPKPKWKQVQEIGESRDLTAAFTESLLWRAPKIAETKVFTKSFNGSESVEWHVHVAAELQGAYILEIEDPAENNTQVHRQIDRELQHKFPHRILRFKGRNLDAWYWPKKLSSGSVSYERISTKKSKIPDFLAQRLAGLAFTPNEIRSGVGSLEVRAKIRGDIESSKITRDFYAKFKSEHNRLAASISGLPIELTTNYATLTLNRLMFIYFLQKKEFLNGDSEYLQTSLRRISELQGKDQFYNFYRDYLLELFFNRLNKAEGFVEDQVIADIIGDVPYINGGIFGQSEIEEKFTIAIPDETFVSILNFFAAFTWHLDTRPTGTPNEINPEVLGYIFEQYINFTAGGKKENGAYYTKADVTGYMVEATLIPRILEIAQEVGLNPLAALAFDPIRYLKESMLCGWSDGAWLPVPGDLQQIWASDPINWGELDSAGRDEGVLLPNESWVEMFHRRERVEKLISHLQSGGIQAVGSLISLNLNMMLLMTDSLHEIEDYETVDELWNRISNLSVLDPTCGSGAFLFSALEALEEVYGALTDRAQHLGGTGSNILQKLQNHPNERYFIRKHAAQSNLYGTDLMPDAVETAKLRIFLALASCLESVDEIEPLPDLDFNLRCGNLVVGFLSPEDTGRIDGDLFAQKELLALQPQIEMLRSSLQTFGDEEHLGISNRKKYLVATFRAVSRAASEILWGSSGDKSESFDNWMLRVRPLHWFIDFPEVMVRGGFDIVIGNPPYIGRKSLTAEDRASMRGYRTESAPDFYAVCYERSLSLLADGGRHAFVVMLSMAFSSGFESLRKLFSEPNYSEWWSTYAHRPEGLFTGPGVKNTILILGPAGSGQHSTQHNVFDPKSRQWLFETLEYADTTRDAGSAVIRGGVIQDLMEAVKSSPTQVGSRGLEVLGVAPTALYWMPVLPGIPPVLNPDMSVFQQENSGTIRIQLFEQESKNIAIAALVGKLGFAWWACTADNFHVASRDTEKVRAFVQPLADDPKALALSEVVVSEGKKNLIQTLYAGKLYINIRWSSARQVTDNFDALMVPTLAGASNWRALNIWYRKTMPANLESATNTQDCNEALVKEIWKTWELR